MDDNFYSIGDFIIVKYYFPEKYIVGRVTSIKEEGLIFVVFNSESDGLPEHLSECYANFIRIINVEDYIMQFEDACYENFK